MDDIIDGKTVFNLKFDFKRISPTEVYTRMKFTSRIIFDNEESINKLLEYFFIINEKKKGKIYRARSEDYPIILKALELDKILHNIYFSQADL